MEWLNRNVGAFKSAPEQTPKVFDAVCVNQTINILFSVINNAVNVARFQTVVRNVTVSVEARALLHVPLNVRLQGVHASVGNAREF